MFPTNSPRSKTKAHPSNSRGTRSLTGLAVLAVATLGYFGIIGPAAANGVTQQFGMPANTTLTEPTAVAITAPSATIVDQGCTSLKTVDTPQPAAVATLLGKHAAPPMSSQMITQTDKIRFDQTLDGAKMTPATPAMTGHVPASG